MSDEFSEIQSVNELEKIDEKSHIEEDDYEEDDDSDTKEDSECNNEYINEDDNDNEEDNKGDKKKKKKKRHYFEHHIRKILREICPLRDITQKAKEQLNEVMIVTCKIITNKALFIVKSNGKKTLSENDLQSAIKLVFVGQLSQKSVEEGRKCLKNYSESVNDKNSKGKSRNEKADILVPPSLLEKFLKIQGLYVSSSAPIFLAGVIEYFVSQILELANNSSIQKNNVRLTVYDIENGIKLDRELNSFFVSNNIYLQGSGIVSYIHPNLKTKTSLNDIKSLKIIEKIQENTDYIFPKTCIDAKFKSYIELTYPDARYQKDCFMYFQDYLEKWMVELLQNSNNITLYSKKTRVTSNDIELALSIMERRQPSFLEASVEEQQFIKFDDKDDKEDI